MAATWQWDDMSGVWSRVADGGRCAGEVGTGLGKRATATQTGDAGAGYRAEVAGWQPGDAGAEIQSGQPRTGDAVLLTSAQSALLPSGGDGLWLLNEGAARQHRMDDAELGRLWRMAGISTAASLPDERLFRVAVVHLEPLSIFRLDAGGRIWKQPTWLAGGGTNGESDRGSGSWKAGLRTGMDNVRRESGQAHGNDGMFGSGGRGGGGLADALARWPQDAALRRVARAAVRALYALRLDIGEADIALSGDGRCAVRGARPMLRDDRQQEAALRRFAAWHAAAHGETADRRGILIGADPEFLLLMPGGKVAPASRYFGGGGGGAAGADAVLVGRRLLYPVAELRPAPAEGPAALAANVRRLMLAAAVRARDPMLRWVAGAMPVPGLALGGHIHISGAPLSGRLLRMLDSCAAYPLALVEDPAGRGRRPRYGALGDFRHQPHGGFEYRTLPSWLVSPAAAKAAFALALLCAREAMTLPRIPASADRYAAAYYAGDRAELAGSLDEIADALSRSASYPALARYIEPLFDAARRGKTWDERSDIRVKWRVPPFSERRY